VTRSVCGYLTGVWGLFITTGAAQRHNPPHAHRHSTPDAGAVTVQHFARAWRDAGEGGGGEIKKEGGKEDEREPPP
jgi:hypothetical protein